MPTRTFSSLYFLMKLHSFKIYLAISGQSAPLETLLFYIKVVKATFRNLQKIYSAK